MLNKLNTPEVEKVLKILADGSVGIDAYGNVSILIREEDNSLRKIEVAPFYIKAIHKPSFSTTYTVDRGQSDVYFSPESMQEILRSIFCYLGSIKDLQREDSLDKSFYHKLLLKMYDNATYTKLLETAFNTASALLDSYSELIEVTGITAKPEDADKVQQIYNKIKSLEQTFNYEYDVLYENDKPDDVV